MVFSLKHIYYDSYHLGNTFKSPFYPVNPEVIAKDGVRFYLVMIDLNV